MRHDYNTNTMNTKRNEDKNFGLTEIQRECKETGPVIETIGIICNFVEKIVVNF